VRLGFLGGLGLCFGHLGCFAKIYKLEIKKIFKQKNLLPNAIFMKTVM
jgi:hypothetical protein